ncbi:MAG: DUF6524 family protein [Gammaproteobacteria bacterium]|nr:DUF6524 family protein [Gammaproteobacteria bacterium]MDH4254732.1 DUF6524 family protein [Gammaproteobacteria bacterium]MDH5308690.1 DUF6524 family protein [Gammaproteobacteria bacterium]
MGTDKRGSQAVRSSEFSLGGLLLRFLAALLLVLATYNPTDLSYYDWVRIAMTNSGLGPEHYFVGVLILIGWTVFVVASIRALGVLGMALGVAFFATLIWLLIDFGILAADSAKAVTWIALVCLAGLLAIGVSWSHVWRKLTGQFEVSDED